ncbi:MAG: hypothetical protein AAF721_24230 [Myxococcota bacterium]
MSEVRTYEALETIGALSLAVAACGAGDPGRGASGLSAGFGAPSYGDESSGGADGDADGDAGEDDPRGEPEPGEDGESDGGASDGAGPQGDTDPPFEGPRPILFVHGSFGGAEEFDVMRERLIADGWASDHAVSLQISDPWFGCNVDNANEIAVAVQDLQQATGAPTVDIVAHSMGSLSSRHYIKSLGGAGNVHTFVSLGAPHGGVWKACAGATAPLWLPEGVPLDACSFVEMCPLSQFLADLNAAPATPAPVRWTSICSTMDTVVPATSCAGLDGAHYVEFDHLEHAQLLTDVGVYDAILAALD